MPRIQVEIVGDASQLSKTYRSAERDTKRFGQSIERAGRGAAVGTGLFRGLGRSIAFASGGFLAFATAGEALRSVIDAGTEAAVTQRQLQAQLKATGISYKDNQAQIEETATRLSSLSGFTRDDLTQAFTTLVRTTHSVEPALKDMSLAADVARGRHISLAQAAITLSKAEGGNLTALRRLGIQIPKGASATEALRIVTQRFTGQAEAGATAQQKFGATLHTTEELIGTTLMPTLNRYLGRFSVWLDKVNRSGKLQRDTAAAIKTLQAAAGDAAPAVKNTGEGLKLAGDHSTRLQRTLKFMLGLPNIFQAAKIAVDDFNKALGRTKAPADDARVAVGAFVHTIGQGGLGQTRSPLLPAQNVNVPGVFEDPFADARGRPLPKPPKGVTAAQKNTWFDALISRELGRVQDITSLRGQNARLSVIAQQIQARLATTKDITRRLNLQDRLLDVFRTQRQNRATLSDELKQQAKDAADAAKAARQAMIDAKTGWLDFAVERADATKTLKDDVRAQQNIIKFLQGRIKHEGRTLELVRGIWEARQKIRDLNKKNADVDPLAGLVQVSSKQLANILAAGTGLGVGGRRILGANIAGAEIQPTMIHNHFYVDGTEVASSVTKHQTRAARRTTNQTSGRRG